MFQRIILPPSSGSSIRTLLGLLDPPKKKALQLSETSVPIYSEHCMTAQKTWIFICGVKQSFSSLLVPENEGTMILQNKDNYTPWGMVCHPRRPKSSATLLW